MKSINLTKVVKIIFIGFCLLYVILIMSVLCSDGYMPYHEDEAINYNSGRLFFETSSVKAEGTTYENVSPVFGSNWYGLFYNIFYGSINKIFGLSSKNFITVNALLLIFTFYLLFKINIGKQNKFLFGIAVFLIPNVVYFLFGFWPVIINLTLSVSLAYLIFQLGYIGSNELKIRKLKILYVALCTIYILINPLWAIWSLGLLPFFKNLKGLLINLFIAGFVIVLSFIFSKFFCATFVSGNTTIMFAYIFSFQFNHFFHLVKVNFFDSLIYFYSQNKIFFKEGNYDNVINQLLLFALLFFSPIYFLINKKRIYFSISLISLAIFITLITVYSTEFEYFQRILTPVYALLLFGVFSSNLKPLKIIVILLLLISFPFSLRNSYYYIKLRKKMFDNSSTVYRPMIRELNLMKYYVDVNKPAVIQWAYFEHNLPRAVFTTNLPLSDTKNHPITYTTKVNCFNPKICDTIAVSKKFQRFGKLPVNYALSKNRIDLPYYHLLMDQKNIKLYRIDSAIKLNKR